MRNIDFLPEHIRQRRLRARRLARYGYVLACAMVAVALWEFSWRGRVSAAYAQLTELQDRHDHVKKQLSDRESLQRQQAQLLIKERISNTLGSRVSALDLLAEIERVLPPHVSLRNLSMEAVQVKVPIEVPRKRSRSGEKQHHANVNRVRFTVTAIAPTDVDVANSIAQLSSSPLLEDINMAYARTVSIEGRQAKEFQAVCHVAR